ncbi:MAG: ectoine/hydroxyectoine ABC transporter substrate-binding protein EhuB [Phycisphaerae bacterium]
MTRHQKINALIAIVGLIIIILVIEALRSDRATNVGGSLLAKLRKQGFVRVGFADEAPFAYIDSKTGKLTGESPSDLRYVMKKLGVPHLKGVLTNFGALIPGLEAHRFDIIAAGMYITPARGRQVLFSNPTFALGDGFVVKRDNPLHLHSFADVAKNLATRLGVVAGAQEYQYAIESGVKPSQISVFPSAPTALAALQAGRIDAYAGTALTVRRLVKLAADPNIAVARRFSNPVVNGHEVLGYGAFAFRKRDTALCRNVDAVLRSFVNSPAHLKLIRRFGFTRTDLPGRITARKIVAGKR